MKVREASTKGAGIGGKNGWLPSRKEESSKRLQAKINTTFPSIRDSKYRFGAT